MQIGDEQLTQWSVMLMLQLVGMLEVIQRNLESRQQDVNVKIFGVWILSHHLL